MVNPYRFYTYAYLREDRTPYYIGKGCGDRIYSSNRTTKKPKDKSRIIFLKQNLSEEEAFKHEIYMIAVFGRKDLGTGILHNRTNGGEGSVGFVMSEETKRKISKSTKGKKRTEEFKNKMKIIHTGRKKRPHTEETKRKMSQSRSGQNNPMYGKNHNEETKEKIRESNVGKERTEETKRKMSQSRSGQNNSMYGKNHSEETKEKIREKVVSSFSVISPTGEIIHSKNTKQFCIDNNLSNGNFCKVLNGKRKSHKGFRLYIP